MISLHSRNGAWHLPKIANRLLRGRLGSVCRTLVTVPGTEGATE
jgi:hypothetical protein